MVATTGTWKVRWLWNKSSDRGKRCIKIKCTHHAHLWDRQSSQGQYLMRQTNIRNLKSLALAVPEISQGCKIHVILTTLTWGSTVYTSCGQIVHKIWSFYLLPWQGYFRGCKILKCVTWPWPRPLQGWFVVGSRGLATYTDKIWSF